MIINEAVTSVLKKRLSSGHHSITIPAYKEIAKGTLNSILDTLSHHSSFSKQELVDKIRE